MRELLCVWLLVTVAFGIGIGTGWWVFGGQPAPQHQYTLKATYDCTRERAQWTSFIPPTPCTPGSTFVPWTLDVPTEHRLSYTCMPDQHWWRYEPMQPRISAIPQDGQQLRVPGPETVDVVFRHDLTMTAHISAPAGTAMEGEAIIIELRSPAPARTNYRWDARYSFAYGIRRPEQASGQYDVCKFLLMKEAWVAVTCTENTQSLVPFARRLE